MTIALSGSNNTGHRDRLKKHLRTLRSTVVPLIFSRSHRGSSRSTQRAQRSALNAGQITTTPSRREKTSLLPVSPRAWMMPDDPKTNRSLAMRASAQVADVGGDIRMASSTSGWARSVSPPGGSGIGDCITARGISCVGGNWLSSDVPEPCVDNCGPPPLLRLPAPPSPSPPGPCVSFSMRTVGATGESPVPPLPSPLVSSTTFSSSILSPGERGRGAPSCARMSTTSWVEACSFPFKFAPSTERYRMTLGPTITASAWK